MTIDSWFSTALWLAALGNLCVLGASLQAPFHLNWVEDLAKLRPLNRKIFWAYAAFIDTTIVTFGFLTAYLHDEMLSGNKAARALALFIGIWWGARLLVGIFYYHPDDWPKGRYYSIGQVLLTLLMVVLTVAYLGLVAWQALA
jgi:hypothetical protein